MKNARVVFDHGPLPDGTLFDAPRHIIIADQPSDVPAALAALEDAQARGHWLAGYASYELGYLLAPKLRDFLPTRRKTPLLQFGVFDAPQPSRLPAEKSPATLSIPAPDWQRDDYVAAFDKVHDFICRGDIYQANLTFPMTAQRTGTVDGLYAALRAKQAAPFGALVDLGGPVLLSRSPELFFHLDPRGKMTARPMKGTAPRGASPDADEKQKDWLRSSEKNQAENLMIVDLLRNDMSRISQIGSVEVPRLFAIETYQTLHQMTSTITAQIRSGTTISEIFEALFPCGSITGAPKIRAMQILATLEPNARDAYCGAIGWIAPDGAMSFGVAIRTLICGPDNRVTLNVGGGVVYDSTADDEYAEALLKARFAMLG